MSSRPACTVVVPTYDREDLLARTLDALVGQSLGAGAFEVVVVDDGSRDGTRDRVAAYTDRLDLRYFFQPDEGFRVAAARNVGIRHARSDVCVFLDSGVLPHSGALAAHVRHHDGAAPAAVVGYVYCFDHDDTDGERIVSTLDLRDVDGSIAVLRAQGRWLDDRESFYVRYGEDLHDLPAPWLVYWTCNVSASTRQLRAVGGFDEAFRRWGGEDLDLAYRLHRSGARFVLDRDAAAVHHPHPKDHAENKRGQRDNFRYLAGKYATPVTQLLVADPPIGFFDLNDYIRRHRVPHDGGSPTRT